MALKTPEQALKWARDESFRPTADFDGWCLRFVARAYGLDHAGVSDAWTWWESVPEHLCHYTRTAPPGSIVAFKGGTHGYGHAAISCGKGYVYTSGWRQNGRVERVRVALIESRWHMVSGRWAYGYFPKGV
jgi:hypothetical protein